MVLQYIYNIYICIWIPNDPKVLCVSANSRHALGIVAWGCGSYDRANMGWSVHRQHYKTSAPFVGSIIVTLTHMDQAAIHLRSRPLR